MYIRGIIMENRKSYQKPELKINGKLKDATLGGGGSGGDATDERDFP